MITFGIISLTLADSGLDPTVIMAIFVASVLFLIVILTPGKKPKKEYCPFCGRRVDYPTPPEDKGFQCPYCKVSL